MFELALSILVSYLIGSLNSSLILGKINNYDVRKHGSGNAGATNTFRLRGKIQGTLVLCFDCLKGFCPAFITVKGKRVSKPIVDVNLPDVKKGKNLGKWKFRSGDRYNILLAGIGGTGIVSMSQMLSVAAHIDGMRIVATDQTGLAQKYGKEHFDNFLRNLYTTYPTPDPNISAIEYLNQLKEGRPQFHMKWAYIYDFMHSINEYFLRKGETL
jgi:hypothetical protein